jgi:hypothetical protein
LHSYYPLLIELLETKYKDWLFIFKMLWWNV